MSSSAILYVDGPQAGPEVIMMEDPEKRLDAALLRSLPMWQILLLERSLGLRGTSRMSDRQIAKAIGETPKSVRLIREEALRTLREDPEVCQILQ